MKFSQRFLVLIAVLLVGLSAFAQTTANLTGTVRLEGNPLPGATVTISSPAMQGTRTTTTDVNGNYNFGGVPPGEYTVKFEMESMQSVTRTSTVGVSQTGRIDTTMHLSSVAESITVTASAPAVLETTEIQANVQEKLVDDLPMGRRLQDAALLTPGVNNNGPNAGTSITISGAPAYDSVFMVNGAVINENLRGQAHNLFIEDAIQETTVITGAVSAEYGRFTGGVVNAITKSGGNEFHGSARDSMTNDKWTSINSQFYEDKHVSSAGVKRADKINPVYEATLGGRIIRDRLWFFLAGRDANLTSGVSLTPSDTPGSDTVTPSFSSVDHNKRYEGKLTGQITPQHTLVGSYLDVTEPQTNNCFVACYEFSNLDLQRDLPNSFYSVHYNGILTNSLLVEANYSKKKFAFKGSGGDFTDFDHGTAWYDLNTGAFFGAPVFCGICGEEDRNNDYWTAKATYYLASKSFGTHNLVGGIENWKEVRLSNNHQSGSDYFINVFNSPQVRNGIAYPEVQSGDRIQYSPIFALSKGSDLQTFSAYLNDKLDLNPHFSFNVGARYDKNDGKDALGATTSKDNAISPRLGMIYDVQGNGRYRVNASYSQYVSKIQETIGGSGATAGGSPATIYYEYRGDPINTDHTLTTPQVAHLVQQWFLANGGTSNTDLVIAANIPGLNLVIQDSLKSPAVTEETVGFGMQLGSNGFVRVDGTHRDWKNFYATVRNQALGQVQDQFGQPYDLGVIQNSDAFSRKYNAATIQAAYRPWQRVDLGANYTYSTLKGNVASETSGSGPVSEAKLNYPEFKAFAQNSPVGYLPSDERHRLRAWASYDLPTFIGKFNFSALERFDSGLPYSAVGNVNVRPSATLCPSCPGAGIATGPGAYANPPTTSAYYFSGRGAFRFDDVTATDLAVNYELPISRVSLFINTDILNIFNEQAQIGGNTTVLTSTNDATLARFDPFTTTPVLGVNYKYGSNFGKSTTATTGSNTTGSYQLPRTFRISFGARF